MSEVIRIFVALTGFILVFGFVSAESKPPGTNPISADKQLAESSNRFGFKLFQDVVQNDGAGGNVFISPLSVSFALAMTLNGAEGSTYDDIAATLELEGRMADEINASFKNLTTLLHELDPSVTFEIANSIWYRSGLPISKDFIDINQTNFGALVRDLDFNSAGAAGTINSWVSDKTNDKIKEIVKAPIDPATIMFLINAIYFKGSWAAKFDPNSTRDHPFYPEAGNQTRCRMMLNSAKFDYFENDLFQAVSLPYGDNGFAMTVFLPRPEMSVNDLIDRLDEQNWSIWQKSFFNTKVELGLPRFRFDYDITMNESLQRLGMATAFDNAKADFKKMLIPGSIPDRNIFIDQVKHKTFLQVDEEGTEAAAVTSVTMALTSAMPAPTPVMIVERPFLFAISETNTGSIVFIGRVTDPVWKE